MRRCGVRGEPKPVFIAGLLSLPAKEKDVRAGKLILDAKVRDSHEILPVFFEECISLLVVIEDRLMSKDKGVVGVKHWQSFHPTSVAGLQQRRSVPSPT